MSAWVFRSVVWMCEMSLRTLVSKSLLRVTKGKEGYQIGLGDYIEYLVSRVFAADVKLSSIVMNDFYFVIKFTKSMSLVSTWHFSCKKINNYLHLL